MKTLALPMWHTGPTLQSTVAAVFQRVAWDLLPPMVE